MVKLPRLVMLDAAQEAVLSKFSVQSNGSTINLPAHLQKRKR